MSGHPGVKIKSALTDIGRARNWALATAEELSKASPLAQEKIIKIEKVRAKCEKAIIRKGYVNDVIAYFQGDRHSRIWTFLGEYGHLKLA